jgi:hypothetical protein
MGPWETSVNRQLSGSTETFFFGFAAGGALEKSVFFADILLIVDHPSELDHGEVRGKLEASSYGRLISGRVER